MHRAAATPQSIFGVVGRLLCLALLWLAWCGVAAAEEVTSFTSDITINADSSVLITETITYDFGGEQKHGIFRNIPDNHPQSASVWYKERYIKYELLSVERDGFAEPYSVETDDGLSIKIGDPHGLVTGKHVYEITYLARGALVTYGENQELYWNITGNDWSVPILYARAMVRAGDVDVLGAHTSCYVGVQGSTRECLNTDTFGEVTVFDQYFLMPTEGLTIAQELLSVSQTERLERVKAAVFWLLLGFAALLSLGYSVYRWRNKNRSTRVVVPQYEPYANFSPLFTGVLFDNKLNSRDVTAGLVYLAQKGYISIKEVTSKAWHLFDVDDYEITLLKPEDDNETVPYQELLRLFFVFTDTAPKSILLSKVKANDQKLRKNYFLLDDLKKEVRKELIARGLLQEFVSKSSILNLLFILIFVALFVNALTVSFFPYAYLIIIFALIVVVGSLTMFAQRRTKLGFEALYHLKGFRLFLSVTDKERFTFHNAPALNPETFMEYLPYAIALGVETEWAEVFKNVSIDSPMWYESNYGVFDAASFGQHLGMLNIAMSKGMSLSPSSGGSGGGFSGGASFGGGFSGGGGGGGGGGSW